MQKPPPDPDVADIAPSDDMLTAYDEEHIITYLRLLDADAKGADWREVARIARMLVQTQQSQICPHRFRVGRRSTLRGVCERILEPLA
jgi:hypothetical protein